MHIKRRDQRFVQLLSMSLFLQTLFNLNVSINLRSAIQFVRTILLVGLSFFCFACGSTSKLQENLNPQTNNAQSATEKPNNDLRLSEMNKSTIKGALQYKDSRQGFKEDLPSRLNKNCVKAQYRLYKQAMVSTQEYTQVFMQEMEKLKINFDGFQLSMRRSQMMIFFGNGLIKRLSMIETIADCVPLYKRYQKDRAALFNKIEISQLQK